MVQVVTAVGCKCLVLRRLLKIVLLYIMKHPVGRVEVVVRVE